MKPFANEEESIGIDDMTIENRLDRLVMYGSIQFTRDQTGLKLAREMKDLMDRTVAELELEKENLPENLPPPSHDYVKNPFKG